jgi:hypothetical protein
MSRKERIAQLRQEQACGDSDKLNADTPALPKHLAEQLKAIEPQDMHFSDEDVDVYPCAVQLDDGQVHPCAYLMSVTAAARCWWLKSDKPSQISLRKIANIESSPFRLPEKMARKIYGESRMGSLSGIFQFNDGRSLQFLTVESLEFPMIPEGYSIANIIDVKLHEDFGDNKHLVRSKPYVVALFRDGSYAT